MVSSRPEWMVAYWARGFQNPVKKLGYELDEG